MTRFGVNNYKIVYVLGVIVFVCIIVLFVIAGMWVGSKSDEHWLTEHEFFCEFNKDNVGAMTMIYCFDVEGHGTTEIQYYKEVIDQKRFNYTIEGDQLEISIIGGETNKYIMDKKASMLRGIDTSLSFKVRDKNIKTIK